MIVRADARRIPLADESVQCVVTSPPYWGLRKYKGDQEINWDDAAAEHGQNGAAHVAGEASVGRKVAFGLEPTVDMYVQHTVEILREIRRVLRRDGVVFWNIGDSYQSGSRGTYDKNRVVNGSSLQAGFENQDDVRMAPNRLPQYGLKPKDLCLIPARVALAAQADVSVRNGREDSWWVRSLIIWAKPNPMPESVTDRPTDAYEHILMLTKSERYFWDAEAVRELAQYGRRSWSNGNANFDYRGSSDSLPIHQKCRVGESDDPSAGRNLRNVWTFPTQAYSGAHFATFPEEIPRRCILAATSARGACVRCGAPWKRLISREEPPQELRTQHNGPDDGMVMGFGSTGSRYGSGQKMQDWLDAHPAETVGWQPTCECEKEIGRLPETVPCLILDPFGGSGTTGRVAIELNRRAVLLDLAYSAEDYAPLARERLRDVQREMFA